MQQPLIDSCLLKWKDQFCHFLRWQIAEVKTEKYLIFFQEAIKFTRGIVNSRGIWAFSQENEISFQSMLLFSEVLSYL